MSANSHALSPIVAVDIGGTNVRFALARFDGGTVKLHQVSKLETEGFANFADAWNSYEKLAGGDLPRLAVIAVAGPVRGGCATMTNHHWTLNESDLRRDLALDNVMVVNDLAAIAHCVDRLTGNLDHFGGPPQEIPDEGTISIIGLGTGLGGALVIRRRGEPSIIESCEPGHAGFAPSSTVDVDLLHAAVRRHGRASVERLVAGPAITLVHRFLHDEEDNDVALWSRALDDPQSTARESAMQVCAMFGSAAGDIALTHGARAVVLVGGMTQRISSLLADSLFMSRFTAKGRFNQVITQLPVKILKCDEAGLTGAAFAFAARQAAVRQSE